MKLKDEVIAKLQKDIFLQGSTTVNGSSSTQKELSPYPTSFTQVMECIEKGSEIPGLESVVVEPTHDAIKDSTLTLPKKPWEKSEYR